MSYNSEKNIEKMAGIFSSTSRKKNLARMKREERARIKEEKKLKIKLVRLEYKKNNGKRL